MFNLHCYQYIGSPNNVYLIIFLTSAWQEKTQCSDVNFIHRAAKTKTPRLCLLIKILYSLNRNSQTKLGY